MEVEFFKTILSEWWLIYLLFFMIVWGFIWKWVPYIANTFKEIVIDFKDTLKEMQLSYKEELKEIRETFIFQIEKSNNWHESHNQKIDEIKNLVKSKKCNDKDI